MRLFVEKCLATAALRLPARDLLKDPFLQIDDCGSDLREMEFRLELDDADPLLRQPFFELHHSNSSLVNGYSNGLGHELENGWEYHLIETDPSAIELFTYEEDKHSANVDISIKGRRRGDGIYLRLRIADKEG